MIFVAQYAEEYSRAYQGPLAPHIFAVAAVAYQDMVRENRDQCCVISGTAIVDITHHTHTLSLCVCIYIVDRHNVLGIVDCRKLTI